jgi:hypothetical protein
VKRKKKLGKLNCLREGMKMMGLKDSTYYLAWFILFFMISSVTSLIVSLITCLQLFKNLDFLLLFMFFLFYSQTLLGISFIVVAFLPNKRSSAIAAVLFNFISFFLTIIQSIFSAFAKLVNPKKY